MLPDSLLLQTIAVSSPLLCCIFKRMDVFYHLDIAFNIPVIPCHYSRYYHAAHAYISQIQAQIQKDFKQEEC